MELSLRKRFAKSSKIALAAAAIAAVIGVGLVSSPQKAEATIVGGPTSQGAGYNERDGDGDPYGYLGNFIINGTTYAYCIEMGIDPTPSGGNYSSGAVLGGGATFRSHVPGSGGPYYTETIDPNNSRAINYILARHGQTASPEVAAGLQLAVWAFANPQAWAASGLSYFAPRVPSSAWPTVVGYYNLFIAEGQSVPAPGGGSGSASLDINMSNGYNGTVRVNASPANATGTLNITGAKFTDGSTSKAVRPGDVLPIIGTPTDAATSSYQVAAQASFTATVGGGYSNDITVHYRDGGGQAIVTRGTDAQSVINFNASRVTTDPVLSFEPVVTTVAPQFAEEGQQLSDKLFASVKNAASPSSNPWRKYDNGDYLPIVARGSLYGPLNDRPTQSATVPAGTPLVASDVTVRMTGPGEYSTPGNLPDLVATEAGYYTWVWSIDYADQGFVAQQSIPANYNFTDAFGQTVETTVVPTNLVGSTEVVQTDAGTYSPVQDKVTLALSNGEWLNDGGAPIPVVLTGDAYFVPGEETPALSDTVPANAALIDTVRITTSTVGETVSPPVYSPGENGWVVWVWSIRNADQQAGYQGYFKEWSDQFGVASEMTRIALPEVTTQSSIEVPLTDDAFDTALVSGIVPANSTLSFQAFRKVTEGEGKVDTAGLPILDEEGNPVVWTAEEIAEYEEANGALALCEAQPVFSTTTPVAVNEGLNENVTYESERARFASSGTYYWVETLNTVNPTNGQVAQLHRGECGLPNETTTVSVPKVTTKATPEAEPDAEAFDTATVNGFVPTGATLTFEAFREVRAGDTKEIIETPVLDADGNPVLDENGDPELTETKVLWTAAEVAALTAPVCSTDTLVFSSSDQPVAVAAGFNDNAEYKGPATKFTSIGTYYWVETLSDRDGNALHRGVCGEPAETTKVVKKPVEGTTDKLPNTGQDDRAAWLFGGLSGALVLAGAGVYFVRRRFVSVD